MPVSPSSSSSVRAPCGRLCLGSASSLSFEEEEMGGQGQDNNNVDDKDPKVAFMDARPSSSPCHHLHDLMTESLLREVEAMLQAATGPGEGAGDQDKQVRRSFFFVH